MPTANNSTEGQSIDMGLIVNFGFYIAFGFTLFTTNLLIVAVVLWYSVLRIKKEFIIMAALAFVDGLNGVGAFSAGIQRTVIILNGQSKVLVGRFECFARFHNLVWNFSEIGAPVMLLVVAVDRLIAVLFPTYYFKFTARYGWTFVACAFGFVACMGAYGGITVYPYRHPEVPNICLSSTAYTDFYSNLEFYIQCGAVILCLPVYVAVFVAFRKKQHHTVWPERSMAHQNFVKMQRRLIVTLAISSIFSVVLYEIPTLLLFLVWMGLPGFSYGSAGPVLYALSLLNPIFNLFIYAIRHKEIRIGITFLFRCKQFTPMHISTITGHHA